MGPPNLESTLPRAAGLTSATLFPPVRRRSRACSRIHPSHFVQSSARMRHETRTRSRRRTRFSPRRRRPAGRRRARRRQWWIESGQSLDNSPKTPQRLNQIRNADVVVSRGLHRSAGRSKGSGPSTKASASFVSIACPRLASSIPITTSGSTRSSFLMRQTPWPTGCRCAIHATKHCSAATPRIFRARVLKVCDQNRPAMDAVRGGFLTLDRGFVPLARRFALDDVPLDTVDLNDPNPLSVKMLGQTAKVANAKAIFANDQIPRWCSNGTGKPESTSNSSPSTPWAPAHPAAATAPISTSCSTISIRSPAEWPPSK